MKHSLFNKLTEEKSRNISTLTTASTLQVVRESLDRKINCE